MQLAHQGTEGLQKSPTRAREKKHVRVGYELEYLSHISTITSQLPAVRPSTDMCQNVYNKEYGIDDGCSLTQSKCNFAMGERGGRPQDSTSN